jgi:hypothetical protein
MRPIVELRLGLVLLRCFSISGKRTRGDVRRSVDVYVLDGLDGRRHVALWPCYYPLVFRLSDKPYLDECHLEVEGPMLKSSTCMSTKSFGLVVACCR